MKSEDDNLCSIYILELKSQLESWKAYLDSIRVVFDSNDMESDNIVVQGIAAENSLNEIKESVKISLSFSHFDENEVERANLQEVLRIEKEIEKIKKECVSALQKNTENLRSEIIKVREEIDSFSNPFRSLSSVYSKNVDRGEIIEVEV